MLNCIWLGLILSAVLIGGFDNRMKEVADAAVKSAGAAVGISIGLIGVWTVWLGMMRLAEKAGLVRALARLLHPALRRLFPEVPPEHPAMGAMVLNIAANMLGLSNAATPLGLRAMKNLESLSRLPGTATNAMCTFLVINTGSVQLIPVTAITVLAASGSKNPSAIIGTALLATACACAAGLIAVKTFEKWRMFRLPEFAPAGSPPAPETTVEEAVPQNGVTEATLEPLTRRGRTVLLGFAACMVWFLFALTFPNLFHRQSAFESFGQGVVSRFINAISALAIPCLLAFFPLYAALRRIPVYEEFVEGAKDGFNVAVRIIPYLVAMWIGIGMFRGAGGIDLLTYLLGPVLRLLHFPPELMPIALMRPLSGSGALALFSDLARQLGPDNLLVRMAGTIYGSTETTFYVIAVYFGAVNVKRTRHAIPAGLVADAVGVIASVIVCRLAFGGG
jgi:spore maturation protein SpmA